MKCLFLENPASGRGGCPPEVFRRLSAMFEVEAVRTESAADMERRVRESAHERIVFAGGDGTFHTVLQAAAQKNAVLGYLPTGTMNDVARSVGIPRDLGGALDLIERGHIAHFDCMRVNGSLYCMYLAAAGTVTRLAYETPSDLKRRWGRLAYVLHGVGHDLSLRPFPAEIRCDGGALKTVAAALFLMNGRVVGGCPVNREGSMCDGRAEIAVLECCPKAEEYLSLARFLLGGKGRGRRIATLRGSRIVADVPESVVWSFDGERGIRGSIELEVLPRKVALFAPLRKNF